MFSGIEIRTPFLEHSLAEVINSLPDGMKVRDGIRKWLLRRVAEKYVPRNIAWLAKKTGLAAPAGRWLANGPIRDLFLERMSEHATLSQYYSMAGIRTLLNKHDPTTPGGDASNTLWRLLSLELWLRSW
jgi:asparagine synthase (glutamine-hydrolysing)